MFLSFTVVVLNLKTPKFSKTDVDGARVNRWRSIKTDNFVYFIVTAKVYDN
jgi:hypothetical protein